MQCACGLQTAKDGRAGLAKVMSVSLLPDYHCVCSLGESFLPHCFTAREGHQLLAKNKASVKIAFRAKWGPASRGRLPWRPPLHCNSSVWLGVTPSHKRIFQLEQHQNEWLWAFFLNWKQFKLSTVLLKGLARKPVSAHQDPRTSMSWPWVDGK